MSTNTSVSSELLSYCADSRTRFLIFTAFSVTNMSSLPLFILVLYLGYQRWRKQHSGFTAVMTSHSDIFTYNVIALELIAILATIFYCCGALISAPKIKQVGNDIFAFTSPGQNLFHVLTCVERYLAVVHPIAYLGLRQEGGVRIRNISTGLSVLCVLMRPGPGKGDQDRHHVDKAKQRAFHTITAIMGALYLRFLGLLVSSLLDDSVQNLTACAVGAAAVWLTLPCSLVLPVLFLHRAGKLPGCKKATEPG